VGADFINPGLLRKGPGRLASGQAQATGIDLGEPYPEDWGWGLRVKNGGQSYYLGAGGNADGSSDNRDEGEWRVIVEKKQSIGWRFSGQGTITGDDGLLLSVKEILMADPSIRHVHVADV
jgi:hypothetical protein